MSGSGGVPAKDPARWPEGLPMPNVEQWRDSVRTEINKTRDLPFKTGRWSPTNPGRYTLERACALVNAIRVGDLPVPLTSAGPDGVLCLQWLMPDRKLSFYVYDDGLIEYFFATPTRPGAEGEIKERDPIESVNEILQLFVE